MESSVNPGKFDGINGKRRKLNGRMKFHPKHNPHHPPPPNRGNMYGPNPNNYYSQQNPNFCQPQPNIHFTHNSRFQPPPPQNQIHRPIPYHHPHTPLSPESYHQFQPQQPMNNNPNSMPFSYPIFVLDHHCLRNHLPIVNPNYNEQICHQKLMKRHQSLLLERADLVKIQTLLSDSRKILERIVDSQGRKYFVQLEDIGSFTKNVLINVRPFVVDLVALMRTIPTEADIENISLQFNKLVNEVRSSSTTEKESEEDAKKQKDSAAPAAVAKALPQNLQMEIVDLPKAVLKISFRDEADKDYSVKLLIGVVYQNLFQRPNRQASKVAKKKAAPVEGSAAGGDEAKDGAAAAAVVEDNKKSHPISTNILQCRNFAISHVQWFRMNADETTLILIRLLKDICNRFEGFRKGMNPWMLEVFAKYCCSTPNQGPGFHYHGPLGNNNKIELKDAFYRAFQLLSAGIFLIDSVSIKDPIAFMDRPIHLEISPIHLDLLCATAQTLLRVMNYDVGFEIIVGLKPDLENIAENLTVWDGVYITPSIAVHAEDDEDDQDQDQENQDDEMDELTENVDNKKIDEDANIVDDDETDNDEDDAAATESKENSSDK